MNVSHGRTATDVSSSAKGLCTGCKYSLTRYCWWIRELKGFTFGSNILNLLAISVDRHEAFFNSLRYASNMTRKRVAYILTTREIFGNTCSKFEEQAWHIDKIYTNILMFIFVIIPFFLLLAINFRVLHVIKKKGSTNPSANSSNPHRRAVNNVRKVKGNLACVVVVLVSVLCWLPRVFHNISLLFPREDLVSPILIQLSLFFLFLQSSLNPFIYSFYRAEFR
ncbi:adenosine receptor A1-like [Orbicella faveolata]|uniref:adenosine receptor A1-like n=1 Tax=Orbicella faveolata TaxID=48498 RepID=UPI0009E3B645|nr:adenosine receptor A1-like [Orbicella faveolata]